MTDEESILTEGLASIRELEATRAAVKGVKQRLAAMAELRRGPIVPKRLAWLAAGALIFGGVAASPVGAAAWEVAGNFSDFFAGSDESAPGESCRCVRGTTRMTRSSRDQRRTNFGCGWALQTVCGPSAKSGDLLRIRRGRADGKCGILAPGPF